MSTLGQRKLVPKAITQKRGRIYLRTTKAKTTALELTKVFGISSVSPARQTSSDLKAITETTLEIAQTQVDNEKGFAIRCRRVGKHPYSSMDVCKELGKKILERLKNRNLRVDLVNPDIIISAEVRDKQAYIYTERLQGPGGFPLGSQAKVVVLLSGGIDSPVASWLVMKRGCPITPIYVDNTPFTDERTTDRALETAKKLFEWAKGFPRKTYIIRNGQNIQRIKEKAPKRFGCLLCKRLMYRIAERIAEREGAEGVVTGEAIGEQASQTMHNLRVLDDAATKFPIHRPLLGFNKTEIEKLARKIGTFEISTRRAKGCMAAPLKPATKAKLEMVKEAEEKIGITEMVEKAITTSETLDLS